MLGQEAPRTTSGWSPSTAGGLVITLAVLSALVLGALRLLQQPVVCTADARMGLVVRVVGPDGRPLQTGVVVVASDGRWLERLRTFGGGVFTGLSERHGAFTVGVGGQGFHSVRRSVHIPHDRCHVIPQHFTVTLEPSF